MLFRFLVVCVCMFVSVGVYAAEFLSTVDEKFEVIVPDGFVLKVRREMPLRIGDYTLINRQAPLSVMLTFMCDSKDLGKYDTKEKIGKCVEAFKRQYKDNVADPDISFVDVPGIKRYGSMTTVVDKKYATQMPTKDGDYKYWTYMVMRIGDDTVLVASVMSNDANAKAHTDAIQYCIGYQK